MRCPNCDNGTVNIYNLSAFISLACDICSGCGEIDSDYPTRKMRGSNLHELRINNGRTLRQFCHENKLDCAEVSQFERGRFFTNEKRFIDAYSKLAG